MMMRSVPAPSARSAVTKSCSLMLSTMPRTTRACPAHPTKASITTMIRYICVLETVDPPMPKSPFVWKYARSAMIR